MGPVAGFFIVLAWLYGMQMAVKEHRYLRDKYAHVKDSISYEMIQRDGKINKPLRRHLTDSIHEKELIKVGYSKPKDKIIFPLENY